MSRHRTIVIGTVVAAAIVATVVGVSAARNGAATCAGPPDHPDWSVARHWNEATLDAIRRDLPAPTVHARNLFHVSAAMWDAWAAYEPEASGYFVDEDHGAGDKSEARRVAMSHAAFRILEARYLDSVGAVDTIPQLDRLMDDLCLDRDVTTTSGDDPAALGNRIAVVILEAGLADGSNEIENYDDPTYEPANEALVVNRRGTEMVDPNRWQPLRIEQMISQNGIPVEDGVQEFIDSHWGYVTSFSLPDPGAAGMPFDPGPPPYLGDPATDLTFKNDATVVIRFSSTLDPATGTAIDISPASMGGDPLGTYSGGGYAVNPVIGAAYEPNLVNAADFGRVMAEFWADGPESETPPGHWNTLANSVSDTLDPELRIGGSGESVDRLEWDIKLYFALNGAMHDAAVAAWGTKGHYDYARPISMIRYMGGLGQSSHPDDQSYHPDGLPLIDGLVEVVTEETTAAGARHEHLLGHEGEIAVYAWTGVPDDPETELAGVDWILAEDWVPYQLPTFVTPSFAAYVSGHSTFSRAGAEVLSGFTGSEYFPGGLGEWTIPAGSLEFEAGPTTDVTLQWARYADAADQAGVSRLYGGIHVPADDLEGRKMGYEIGRAAWDLAQEYFEGTAGD
ncbi:MAG: vanadium-dependent haloperoxidase [Acidimicrobiia bacterium]|nr:vanadium-dependent haloperoxidase [Acidimicrobiia bacterium]